MLASLPTPRGSERVSKPGPTFADYPLVAFRGATAVSDAGELAVFLDEADGSVLRRRLLVGEANALATALLLVLGVHRGTRNIVGDAAGALDLRREALRAAQSLHPDGATGDQLTATADRLYAWLSNGASRETDFQRLPGFAAAVLAVFREAHARASL